MNAEHVVLSCKEAARLMSHQQDRALSDVEAEELKSHLFVCLSCRNFNEQLGFLRRLASRYGGDGTPSPDEPW
ncbi:MAG: zf-HC2 domain-containing protein [Betaproteobacteria bacterium]